MVNYSIITLIHIFISYHYAYICHTIQKHTPDYTLVPPPEGTPNGGGYAFSKFFYFFIFFRPVSFRIHCLSSILFSTYFKPF